MRYCFLVFMLVFSACASPRTAPNAYYSGTYAPGTVVVDERGRYEATASVFDVNDRHIARKAALARLMRHAKKAGFRYFDITRDEHKQGFGLKHYLGGQLYKSAAIDADVYAVGDIERMLKGLPVRTRREIAEAERKRRAALMRHQTAQKSASRQLPQTTPASGPNPAETKEPAIQGKFPTPRQDDDAPLVILAPEDITGSIQKQGQTTRRLSQEPPGNGHQWAQPKALSGVPSGVIAGAQ